MGNIIFNITKFSSNNIPKSLNSSSYEWLTVHAIETGVPIVEIQRLWIRFKQLGCNNDGTWTDQTASNSTGKIVKDNLHRKILTDLQSSPNNPLTFFEFINACLWLERSSVTDKLKAIFAFMNKGQPIVAQNLLDLLPFILPSKTKVYTEQIVTALFSLIAINNATNNVKEIFEDDFINFIQNQFSRKEIEEILTFKIFPNLIPTVYEGRKEDINEMDVDMFHLSSTIPTEKQLSAIAVAIGTRDYKELAGRLGILHYDLNHLENINRGNRERIVLSILREWKIQQGSRAFIGILKKALYLSGFTDVFNKIEFG